MLVLDGFSGKIIYKCRISNCQFRLLENPRSWIQEFHPPEDHRHPIVNYHWIWCTTTNHVSKITRVENTIFYTMKYPTCFSHVENRWPEIPNFVGSRTMRLPRCVRPDEMNRWGVLLWWSPVVTLRFNTEAPWFGWNLPYWCVLRWEFSGMTHFITINNSPSNPQQPIHSLRETHQ